VVLQHPREVKQTKGTVALLSQSLHSCEVFVGEDFSERQDFLNVIKKYHNKVILLYPSENAQVISDDFNQNGVKSLADIECIILLDGTWKKAYRLFMVNPILQEIAHGILPSDIIGNYQIRKTKKQGALSTLEACCYGLSLIESQPQKYIALLEKFQQFNQMHLAFKPQE